MMAHRFTAEGSQLEPVRFWDTVFAVRDTDGYEVDEDIVVILVPRVSKVESGRPAPPRAPGTNADGRDRTSIREISDAR